MSLKNGLKILRNHIDKQLEFITWLKTKKLYDPMESSHVMQKMYNVWREAKKDR